MIIGFCGPEGAGKSTAAAILQRRRGAVIMPFAKPLKDMLRALGVPEKHLTGSPAEKAEPLDMLCGVSARHAMQTLGTEWGRECIGRELWANAWRQMVEIRSIRFPIIVADDVRFIQEVAAIKALGGKIICVVRSADDFKRTPRHASENFRELSPDAVIQNDGSINDLTARVLAEALETVDA